MPEEADKDRALIMAIAQRKRGRLYLADEILRGHIHSPSDDYAYRDDKNRPIYAVVSYTPDLIKERYPLWDEPKIAETGIRTKSLHEAMQSLNEAVLYPKEDRQIRVGGIAIATRRAIPGTAEDMDWMTSGEEQWKANAAAMASIAAADSRRYPEGAQLTNDEIELDPIPRRFSLDKTRRLDDGVVQIRAAESVEDVLVTAEQDDGLKTSDVDALEGLAGSLAAALAEQNASVGSNGNARRLHDAIASQIADWWPEVKRTRTTTAYASAVIENTLGDELRDAIEPERIAPGYMDADKRADAVGGHLVFYRETLPTKNPQAAKAAAKTDEAQLLLYDRAIKAAAAAHQARTDYGPSSELALKEKAAAYKAVASATETPGFRTAGRHADIDEGLLMQAAWDGAFDKLERLLRQVRDQARGLPETEQSTANDRQIILETGAMTVVNHAAGTVTAARELFETDYAASKMEAPRQTDFAWRWNRLGRDVEKLAHRIDVSILNAVAFSSQADRLSTQAQAERDDGLGPNAERRAELLEEGAGVLRSHAEQMGTEAATDMPRELKRLATKVDADAAGLNDTLQDTSDDSYATRNDLHHDIQFLSELSGKIKRLTPDSDKLDLSVKFEDYGYDAEEAASDFASGIEYVTEADRARTRHEIQIGRADDVLSGVRALGIEVVTEFRTVEPFDEPDYDPADDGQEMTA